MVSVSRFLTLTTLVFSVAAHFNKQASRTTGHAHKRLKQATRASVVARQRQRAVLDRRESPSANTCTCGDGTPCPGDCVGNCADFPANLRRSLAPKARGFVAPAAFSGTLLSAPDAARFFAGHGTFAARNGTHFVDDEYAAVSAHLSEAAATAYVARSILKRAGGKLVRFGSRFFAKYMLRLADAPDNVLALSDTFGVRASELVPMARELLADPAFRELEIYQYSLPRSVIAEIVETLCPKLGLEMCGSASAKSPAI